MHHGGDREKGQFTYCNVSTCVKFELVYSSDFTKYENSALRKRTMFFLGTFFFFYMSYDIAFQHWVFTRLWKITNQVLSEWSLQKHFSHQRPLHLSLATSTAFRTTTHPLLMVVAP